MHNKGKITKNHQTSKIGTPPQCIQKKAVCNVHGKPLLDLVCTHSSHSPCLICTTCVTSSHKGHAFVAIDDYFCEQSNSIQALLDNVKELDAKLSRGIEVVGNEHAAIAGNRESVIQTINTYFTKVYSYNFTPVFNLQTLQRYERILTPKGTNYSHSLIQKQHQKPRPYTSNVRGW